MSNFISNFFSKKNNAEKIEDRIASMLKVSPELLKKFEESYEKQALSKVSDSFFDVNAKQATANNNTETIQEIPKGMIDRIVKELLHQTVYYQYDGEYARFGSYCNPNGNEIEMVTQKEINDLPESIRPQLTGELMMRDIDKKSYISLLEHYKEYMKQPDTKQGRQRYNMFRQGLDILDLDAITYEIIGMNKNSMGCWLPQLVDAVSKQDFFKVPKTTIIKVPLTLLQLTRVDYSDLTPTTIAIVNQFCQKAFNLDEEKEYFIKTGTYSSKFDFRNAYVHGTKEVRQLGEYLLFIHFQACQMASSLSSPCIYGVSTTNEWVVREFIQDKENNPCIYKGLPLHTEYRVFVDFDKGQIIGVNPYWDSNVMKQRFSKEESEYSLHQKHDYIIYSMYEEVLMDRYNQNIETVCEKIEALIPNIDLTGQWSIDIMQNGDDFWIIDMALAVNSALLDCVPKNFLRPVQENWIPQISME